MNFQICKLAPRGRPHTLREKPQQHQAGKNLGPADLELSCGLKHGVSFVSREAEQSAFSHRTCRMPRLTIAHG